MYKLTNRPFPLSGQGTVSLLQGTRELWVDAGMRDRLSCNPLGARDCQSLYWFTAVHSASEFSSVQAQPVELCRFKIEFRQSSYIIWAFFTELRVINHRKKYNHSTKITSIKGCARIIFPVHHLSLSLSISCLLSPLVLSTSHQVDRGKKDR